MNASMSLFHTFADAEQTKRQTATLTFLIANGVVALDEWSGPELMAVLLSFYGDIATIESVTSILDATAEHIATIKTK